MGYDLKKYCSHDCEKIGGVCDSCIHYDFNGDEDGLYAGDGYCNYHKEHSEPHFGCEDFVCFRVKNNE